MGNATHLGLDVHKETVAVAVLRPGATVPEQRVIPNTPEALRKLVQLTGPDPLAACYEAGPTGYDTYRPCDASAWPATSSLLRSPLVAPGSE